MKDPLMVRGPFPKGVANPETLLSTGAAYHQGVFLLPVDEEINDAKD